MTREQIDTCAAYADQRAYDGDLNQWLAAFCWYARELVGK